MDRVCRVCGVQLVKKPGHLRRWSRRGKTGRPSKRVRQGVLNRDGWICYLCTQDIPQDKAWPHPLSGTVDHVKPVSAGGSDDPTNLRAAHWHCNEEKGDRLLGEELWAA